MKDEVIQQQETMTTRSSAFLWFGGIGFTFVLSIFGYGLATIPGFNRIGPMACAILLAILYRQLFGYPEQIRSGIQFSSKQLLRFAIVLYGY